MARVAVTVRLPRSMYRPANLLAKGYTTSDRSRFAAVRVREGEGPWLLVHRRTGMEVGSLLPPMKSTSLSLLKVIAAWDAATHLDLSALDELPECEAGTNEKDIPRMTPAQMAKFVPELRTMAVQALA